MTTTPNWCAGIQASRWFAEACSSIRPEESQHRINAEDPGDYASFEDGVDALPVLELRADRPITDREGLAQDYGDRRRIPLVAEISNSDPEARPTKTSSSATHPPLGDARELR